MERRIFFKNVLAGGVITLFPLENLILAGCKNQNPDSKALKDAFIAPPDSAKPHTWWHWMNGNVTREGIVSDLETMKEAGLGGFQAFHVTDFIPQGPVDYNSHEWHELMDFTIRKADSLGLKMCFHNCAGWSSSGGPWITPEKSAKTVVWNEKKIQGPAREKFTVLLDEPESKHNYYRDIAVIAFPTPKSEQENDVGFRLQNWENKAGYGYRKRPEPDTRSIPGDNVILLDKIIDLTDHLQGNKLLNWKVPDGHWTILRFGYTTTGITNHPSPPEGLGLECDKLSREGAEAHWKGIVERVIEDAGPRLGQTLNSILIDSYETGPQNWTHHFAEEFLDRCGYDLRKYLPCITGRVIESIDISERFLWDFRRTIADMFAENYYGSFYQLCIENGLELYVEPYERGNFDEFQVAGIPHIPMGEFWVNDFRRAWTGKIPSSAAHAYGKKIVASESFTASGKNAGWVSHPYSLKSWGDYNYCKGYNRFVFHTYAHNPWPDLKPGMTMGPHGFQMNRGNTWWAQSKAWLKYLTRTQYMLQSGQFVADICYYFGENVPNGIDYSTGVNIREEDDFYPFPPRGYDFDVFVTDVIMQLEVENGKLILPSGMSYHVLVLPHFDRTLRPEVLQKIQYLIRNGATVLGPKPTRSPSLSDHPECDERIIKLSGEIWGDTNASDKAYHDYGKGRVYWGSDLVRIFDDLKLIPDFQYTGHKDPRIEYLHRRIDSTDIYFISNQEYRYINLKCSFRVTGKIPELWYPQSGRIAQAGMYREHGTKTTIPLFLEPAESIFVVFQKTASDQKHVIQASFNNQSILEVVGDHQPCLTILQARYGILNDTSRVIDVTKQLADHVINNQLQLYPNQFIDKDPAPKRRKQLFVKYELLGRISSVTVDEEAMLLIPDQPISSVFPPAELIRNEEGSIQLQVRQSGDYHILFSDNSQEVESIKSIPQPTELNGPWTVGFPPGWGAPEEIIIDKLISWTEHAHTDIKHFSGTAIYRKEFSLSSAGMEDRILHWLDLGRVYNFAEIFLNNQNLGILWKPPFRLNISEALEPEKNQLEIHVTNLWPNRLIGDEAKPDPRQFTHHSRLKSVPSEWDQWLEWARQEQQTGSFRAQTGRYTWSTYKHYDADDPLLPSGLLGPVRIHAEIIRLIDQ